MIKRKHQLPFSKKFKYSVPISNIEKVTLYCHENVSPRKFHLHGNNVGGEKWCISYCETDKVWKLYVKDDKILTWMALGGDALGRR